MFSTGVTMGLAEWIIDDTPVLFYFFYNTNSSTSKATEVITEHMNFISLGDWCSIL